VDLQEQIEALRSSHRPVLTPWPSPVDGEVGSVALLAGSFDPITVAHLAMAEAALGGSDLVVLTYSVRTLPKETAVAPPLLSEAERIATVASVCAGRPGLALGLSSHGLLADQVAAARALFPGAAISVVLGSDKLRQLFDPRWYEDIGASLLGLFAEAELRYALREGDDVGEALAGAARLGPAARVAPLPVDPAVAAVSSRGVRELARAGSDVSALVPPEALRAVVDAVRREGG